MRDYGQIQCSWWGHPETLRLNDLEKIIFLYLITGPHSNGIGCYRLPMAYIAADLDRDLGEVTAAFGKLADRGFCKYCPKTSFVFIPKYLKWNKPANVKVACARQKEFDDIPKNFTYLIEMINDILEYGKHFQEGFCNGIRSRSETLVRARSDTVSDRDSDQPNPTQPNHTTVPMDEFSRGALVNLSAGEITNQGGTR